MREMSNDKLILTRKLKQVGTLTTRTKKCLNESAKSYLIQFRKTEKILLKKIKRTRANLKSTMTK